MAITRDIRIIVSAVDRYSREMNKVDTTFNTISVSAAAVQAALIGATAAAAAFAIKIGRDVVQSAVDFHDAIMDTFAVAKSFGTSQEQISNILDELVDKFPVTGKEAGSALEAIAQKGFGAVAPLEKLSKAALTLNVATGVELSRGVDTLTSIMNTFNLTAGDTDRVMNLLAATQFKSASNVSDLGSGFRYAGSTAKQFGISLEDTITTLGILRDMGLQASQTGTKFRGALVNLSKGADSTREALKQLNLRFEDVNPVTNTFVEILDQFEGKTVRADQAFKLFGLRNVAFAEVLTTQNQKWRELNKEITGTDAAIQAFTEKSKKYSVVMKNLEGTIDVFKKSIGEGAVPVIVDMIGITEKDGIRGIITQLKNLERAQSGIGSSITKFFQNISDTIDETFKDDDSVKEFYKSLSNISAALSELLNILFIFGSEFAKTFMEGSSDLETFKTTLTAVNVVISGIAVTVSLLHDVFATMWGAFELGWAIVSGIFNSVGIAINYVLLNAYKLGQYFGGDFEKDIKQVEGYMKEMEQSVKKAWDIKPVNYWTDNALKAAEKTAIAIENMGAKTNKIGEKKFEKVTASVKGFGVEVEATENKLEKLQMMAAIKKGTQAFEEQKISFEEYAKGLVKVGKITEEQLLILSTKYEQMMGEDVTGMLNADALGALDQMRDSSDAITESSKKMSGNFRMVVTHTDKIKKDLGEVEKFQLKLLSEKFEAEVDLIKTQLKSVYDFAESKLEWQAKIDITELESLTNVVDHIGAGLQAISTSISGVTGGLSSMIGQLGNQDLSISDWLALREALDTQLGLQEQLVRSQISLAREQEISAKALRKRISENKPLNVKVDVSNISPQWITGLTQELFDNIIAQASIESFSGLSF